MNEDWGISMLLDLKDENGYADRYGKVKEMVVSGMKHTLSTALADRMGQKFGELSKEELDQLAASFAFENCRIDERRAKLLKAHGQPKRS